MSDFTETGFKRINLIPRERYNELPAPSEVELWAVETETYSDNDRNWYRVYADGWCEQGGYLSAAGTVNFLKPFKNSMYTVSHTPIAAASPYISAKTPTSMTIAAGGCWWEARGYISE